VKDPNEHALDHTPGPWEISKVRETTELLIGGLHGSSVVARIEEEAPSSWETGGIGGVAESHENAKLIAAAPDLLLTLRLAIARVEIENAEGNPILSAWLKDAKALVESIVGGE
jgi:hypothetical protein